VASGQSLKITTKQQHSPWLLVHGCDVIIAHCGYLKT
jgi:hypothetical protein